MFKQCGVQRLLAPTSRRLCASLHPPLCHHNEEERLLAESVRNFAQRVVKPVTLKMDEAGELEPSILKECFANGYMGIETSAVHNGSGLSFFSSILAIEELARVDPALSVTVDVQNTLVNNIFFHFANKELQDRYLPRLATDTVGCFCLTEPGSGSDAFALTTRATRQANGSYKINGSKIYITNGGLAGLFLCMATVDPSQGYKGITCFVVDKEAHPGVRIGRQEKKMGIKASSTVEVIFDNVEVPAENIVGEIGKGYKIAIRALNEGRIGIAGQMVGIAQGALDAVLPHVYTRKQFNTVLGDFQGMQFQIAQAQMEVNAARLMVYEAARKKLAGHSFVEAAAQAKLFASQVADRTTGRAIEWAGGLGYMRDFGVERFYRDAKIGAIYEGTSNIQLHTLAKFVKERYAPQS